MRQHSFSDFELTDFLNLTFALVFRGTKGCGRVHLSIAVYCGSTRTCIMHLQATTNGINIST